MAQGLHDEHRKRVRKEFLTHGFDSETSTHKIIEMLLFYSIPRKDTNEIAHLLVNRFKTISGILSASKEELTEIAGVGENTVALLKLIRTINKICVAEKTTKKSEFKSIDEIYTFLADKYFDTDKERVAITTVNGKGQILGFDFVGEGDISSAGVSMREIIEVVIKRKATGVILSHNHPNSSAIPSISDIETTEKIYKLLSDMNVLLLDHVVLTDGDYVSFIQTQNLRYIFKHMQ